MLAVEQPGYLTAPAEADTRPPWRVLLTPSDREGAAGVIPVIHDVTEQRKTEEMRREFVATVSQRAAHPLTNIRSYAETPGGQRRRLPTQMEKDFPGGHLQLESGLADPHCSGTC